MKLHPNHRAKACNLGDGRTLTYGRGRNSGAASQRLEAVIDDLAVPWICSFMTSPQAGARWCRRWGHPCRRTRRSAGCCSGPPPAYSTPSPRSPPGPPHRGRPSSNASRLALAALQIRSRGGVVETREGGDDSCGGEGRGRGSP
jgi:hypothetical protein